jgi:hypothetical protein
MNTKEEVQERRRGMMMEIETGEAEEQVFHPVWKAARCGREDTAIVNRLPGPHMTSLFNPFCLPWYRFPLI